ncbi:hypothetical protein JMJ77_0005665 [Colletotrichum scovillei]|uniref:Uncharacterized protein n=1 Tax=Colletotrichum scovillei TaxID=1209932 RepID=A0A9P7RJG6_9PEZI|nr:hypothetical protein JMJ77_0005665 [Colletotrichum scovillei]KAG7076843.1 hypothetical protein JMJ76_0014102 [Colletotrichum scovillei]KAG7083983.1 hypothetical protein JMJ78_0009423 [Colletotrichum scovillei]
MKRRPTHPQPTLTPTLCSFYYLALCRFRAAVLGACLMQKGLLLEVGCTKKEVCLPWDCLLEYYPVEVRLDLVFW